MVVSHSVFLKIVRDANRAAYEADVANGKEERLPPELEALLFGFQNLSVLTLGFQLPSEEVKAKVAECAAKAGVTPDEFMEAFVESNVK